EKVSDEFAKLQKADAAPNRPKAGAGTLQLLKAEPGALSHRVAFELGASYFADGDKITIEEVHGTAETFAPGNIYSIKGTYTLASHDRAILLASVTLTDPLAILTNHVPLHDSLTAKPMATGAELKVQRKEINRGTGTFTLFLPMTENGAPHVGFYSF